MPPAPATQSFVPFDHAARFELTGRPGNVIQDVINVTADGIFVAVAIGYGLEEGPGRPLDIPSVAPNTSVDPGSLTLGDISTAALIDGFRVNPDLQRLVFEPDDALAGRARGVVLEPELLGQDVAAGFLTSADPRTPLLFEQLRPVPELSFLFSVVDTGSGRELQDEPIHSLASLGKSNGERPFRTFARPVTFLPRSTIRLQIVERSDDVTGVLFIVLYGYKILAPGCSESAIRQLTNTGAGPASGLPESRSIPFDYVTTFRLSGRPGTVHEDEVSVNAEAGFVATAMGYGLEPTDRRVPIVPSTQTTFDLAAVTLAELPAGALLDGLRIRPEFVRLAFDAAGALSNAVDSSLAGELFERLNTPERVSFRYSIFDSGRGIELQNQPIHNIAGLGSGDGVRPFKRLWRPLESLPRSTIRVRVEERSGRGTLFIVFQGFKRLSAESRGRP